jgi:hypothetical protein
MSVVYGFHLTVRGTADQLVRLDADLRDNATAERLLRFTEGEEHAYLAARLPAWFERFAGERTTYKESTDRSRVLSYFWDRDDFYDPAVLLSQLHPDLEFTLVDMDEQGSRAIESIACKGAWLKERTMVDHPQQPHLPPHHISASCSGC